MATTELTVTEVPLPHMASMETATLTTWSKQVGETVAEGETICEVTTEKVDTEIESPASGVVAAHLYEVGVELALGTVVALLVPPGAGRGRRAGRGRGLHRRRRAKRADGAGRRRRSPRLHRRRRLTARPRVRGCWLRRWRSALAKENGIDLASLTGTGSRGKITRDDVLKAVDAELRHRAPAAAAPAPAAPAPAAPTGAGRDRRRRPVRVRGPAGRAHQALERAPRHGGEPHAFVADDAPADARDPDRPLDHREPPARAERAAGL